MNTQTGIYEIRNILNGKRYIGSAVNVNGRWSVHKHHLENSTHDSRHLQRAWDKHGSDAFEFNLVEHVKHKDQLIRREQWWLDALFATGWHYNCSPTAGSCFGVKHSLEVRAKNRLRNLGKTHTPEWRANMSAVMKGRKISPEHRARLSAAMTGKVLAPEHRAAMSAAARKKAPLSTEHRAKLSVAGIGNKNSLGKNTGPLTDVHRANISAAAKGRPVSAKHCASISAAKKGKALSKEHRAKISAGLNHYHASKTGT